MSAPETLLPALTSLRFSTEPRTSPLYADLDVHRTYLVLPSQVNLEFVFPSIRKRNIIKTSILTRRRSLASAYVGGCLCIYLRVWVSPVGRADVFV